MVNQFFSKDFPINYHKLKSLKNLLSLTIILMHNFHSLKAIPTKDANGKAIPQNTPCKSYGVHSYGFPSKIWNSKSTFSIGDYCSIATQVTFFLGGNHRVDWLTTYPFASFKQKFPEAVTIKNTTVSKGNITIKNDVWICEGATILSGVTIENGAVIGANAVVAKDVPPYAVAVGNPAKIVRYRFDQSTIKKLLKIAWWNWSEEKIRKNIHLLCDNNIKEFLRRHYE